MFDFPAQMLQIFHFLLYMKFPHLYSLLRIKVTKKYVFMNFCHIYILPIFSFILIADSKVAKHPARFVLFAKLKKCSAAALRKTAEAT